MTYLKLLVVLCISQFMVLSVGAQTSTDYPRDKKTIDEGKALFLQNCSSCHNFTQRGIGPNLAGVTNQVSKPWLVHFIRNSQEVIEDGDVRAKKLFEEYKVPMPSFNAFSDDEIVSILAYVNTFQTKAETVSTKEFGPVLSDPIPGKIKKAGLTLELEEVTTASPSADKIPLARINQMGVLPGKKERTFIEDLRGKLYELKGKQLSEVMDISKQRPAFISSHGHATGFGSYAFHPTFKKTGLFYTTHTERPRSAPADFSYANSIPVAHQWVLTEWKINNPRSGTFAGESRELWRIDMPTQIHGVQEITFNPLSKSKDLDYGLLYIGIGDGGSAENGFAFLCNTNTQIWSSVMRIDPLGNNSKNGKYGIPSINPFSNDSDEKTLVEIFARGFRNPNRMSWTADGKMLISDIGLNNIEELNMGRAGVDYGWPAREGTFLLNYRGKMNKVYALPADESNFNFVPPVAQYDHDEGNAISAGYAYEGNIGLLKNKYIFGDIVSGRVFYVNTNELELGKQATILEFDLSFNGVPSTFRKITANSKTDLRFGLGANKQYYLFTKTDGKIWKVIGSK
ncbi:PQQ-dependent sugar dehydrogenase [Daejeonella sp.]|uniref:PQQ-dependent sugar dehydrogenase n=1 Tax=Daejeonella sp. TaxID=2805397 RepID=UPI0030C34959